MTRTCEMKADQSWVVVNRKKRNQPKQSERPVSAGIQETSQWRPKEIARKGTKRGQRGRFPSRDSSTPSPSWSRKTRHSSMDGFEDLSASSEPSMNKSASAQNLTIKSFKLVGHPETLHGSNSSKSLSKLSRITPSISNTSLSGLSTSSDDDTRVDTESENEKDLPDWKQALLEAIKEKSTQSVEVPDYVVRALCALSSLPSTLTASTPTVLPVP